MTFLFYIIFVSSVFDFVSKLNMENSIETLIFAAKRNLLSPPKDRYYPTLERILRLKQKKVVWFICNADVYSILFQKH